MTYRDIAPLFCERFSSQCVSQHQVIYMYPVHPGSGVSKPENEQPALHIHLSQEERSRHEDKMETSKHVYVNHLHL